MVDLNKTTVRKKDIYIRHCDACGTKTAHIGTENGTRTAPTLAGPAKQPFNLCLQCFVDANDINEWSRWIDPFTGKRLENPRGVGK